MIRQIAAALALALAGAANAQIVGEVIGVPDGDTLLVRIDRHVLNVDLRSIDAPEVGQPYGADARDSLAALCDAQTIALDELGIDRGRRVFGEVHCGGLDAGEEQVRRGMAWAKPRAADARLREQQAKDRAANPLLRDLQAKARADQRGLWSEPAPIPPWEWSAIFTR